MNGGNGLHRKLTRAEVKILEFKFLFNFTPFFGKMWFIFNSIGTLLYQKCVFRMSEIPCTHLLCLSPPPIVITPYPCPSPHPPLQGYLLLPVSTGQKVYCNFLGGLQICKKPFEFISIYVGLTEEQLLTHHNKGTCG